jgi:hypothetical protein
MKPTRKFKFDLHFRARIGATNLREHRVVATSRRGNDVSLSPPFLRRREWEKVPAGRMTVSGMETNPVERAGVKVCVKSPSNTGALSVPSPRFMGSPLFPSTCTWPINPRKFGEVAISRRGNNVSLSPGERAGVRVCVKSPSNAGALSVSISRFMGGGM